MNSIIIGLAVAVCIIFAIVILRIILSGKLISIIIKLAILGAILFFGVSALLNHFNMNGSEVVKMVDLYSKVTDYTSNIDYDSENKKLLLEDDGYKLNITKNSDENSFSFNGEVDKTNEQAISSLFGILNASDKILSLSSTVSNVKGDIEQGKSLDEITKNNYNSFAETTENYFKNPNEFIKQLETLDKSNDNYQLGNIIFKLNGENIVFHN